MKRLLLSLLVLSLLTACGNMTQPSSGDSDTDSISAQSDTTVAEANNDSLQLKFKVYSDHALYKADIKQKNIYHENTISICWPVSAVGTDVKQLQKALRKAFRLGNGDIEKFVHEWANNTFVETTIESYTKVTERLGRNEGISLSDDEEDGDEYEVQYDTSCEKEIHYVGQDSKRKLLTYSWHHSTDNGCGLGSCIYYGTDYLVYDYANNKVVRISDIIANQALAADELREQCIFSDQYGGLEGLSSIKSLPDNFYLQNDTIVSVFTKYEISFGADGCPELGFDVKANPAILTPYGKQLFGIK